MVSFALAFFGGAVAYKFFGPALEVAYARVVAFVKGLFSREP